MQHKIWTIGAWKWFSRMYCCSDMNMHSEPFGHLWKLLRELLAELSCGSSVLFCPKILVRGRNKVYLCRMHDSKIWRIWNMVSLVLIWGFVWKGSQKFDTIFLYKVGHKDIRLPWVLNEFCRFYMCKISRRYKKMGLVKPHRRVLDTVYSTLVKSERRIEQRSKNCRQSSILLFASAIRRLGLRLVSYYALANQV